MKSKFALLPLFILFTLAILSRASTYSESFIADEIKFYQHARNITQGYYAERVNPNLMEGPGYPLYLAISAALDVPFVWTRASNIIFLFLASLYLFLILKRYIDQKPAIILTYLFALYPPMLRWANLMYAETLMMFLLLGFCYHFIVWFRKENKYNLHFFIAVLYLGYLALTKIIFPYVIVVALIGALALMIFPKISRAFRLKKTALILVGALLVLSPYLLYSYKLTDKFFYLGMHGGEALYARSTPFDNEFGNWFNERHVLGDQLPTGREDVMANLDQLRENHRSFFMGIDSLNYIERDSVLTSKAIENIKNHPGKYLKNTIANVSRFFFHFPFSYRMQNLDTLGYLIPNVFIVVLAILGVYPAIVRRKSIPKELIFLMLLSLIYLGGHSLLDGRGRYLLPAVPIWMIFFAFVYFRILQIRIKESADKNVIE
ncbi:MAG: hypothetical protein HKN89_05445 [Eudoraea sp.]|nr:hypothetical protein [Eudoraea sp.]